MGLKMRKMNRHKLYKRQGILPDDLKAIEDSITVHEDGTCTMVQPIFKHDRHEINLAEAIRRIAEESETK